MLMNNYLRVANWNAKRYDQVYNAQLSYDLLREELLEWYEAKTPVDKLDAVLDIKFVALGIVWKADLKNEVFELIHKLLEDKLYVDFDNPVTLISTVADRMFYMNDDALAWNLAQIIYITHLQLFSEGFDLDEIFAAFDVVCDSNDSKSITKTASDVKANAGNKGPLFICPEPRLQLILDKVEARWNS